MKLHCKELGQIFWHSRSRCDFRLKDQTHVWLIDLDNLTSEEWVYWASFLSEKEILKLKERYYEADRQRLVGRRSALRQILSKYLNLPVKEIIFEKDKQGKVRMVSQPQYPIEFSMSDAGRKVLLAFRFWDRIGIDIENLEKVQDVVEVSKMPFSNQEKGLLYNTKDSEAFYRLWTRKEALTKASYSKSVKNIPALEVDVNEQNVVLNIPQIKDPGTGPYFCYSFQIGHGHLANIALDKRGKLPIFYQFK